MKLFFHLYSAHANCEHCTHHRKVSKDVDDASVDLNMGQDLYCSIVASEVEPDYYCDFYVQRNTEQDKQPDKGLDKKQNKGQNFKDRLE